MSELLISEESETFQTLDGSTFEGLFYSSAVQTPMAGEEVITAGTSIQVGEVKGAELEEGQILTRVLTGKEYEIKSKRLTGIGLIEFELNVSPRPAATSDIFGRF